MEPALRSLIQKRATLHSSSALLPKLLGARIILDLHDPMPELLVTIFGLGEKSSGVRLLKFLEKKMPVRLPVSKNCIINWRRQVF